MNSNPPAFLSYAREDSAFALRLAADLKAAGANVWLDQLDIRPGRQWDREVEQALAMCVEMLVILSPGGVDSSNVMDEVAFALEERKTVIPVIQRDCRIPFRLRRLQYVDFRSDYALGLKTLLSTLTMEDQVVSTATSSPGAVVPVPLEPAETTGHQKEPPPNPAERDKAEAARKAEQDRIELKKAEAARQAEQDRIAREKAEAARQAGQDRIAREKAEATRQAEEDRIAREKAEAARQAVRDRIARESVEAARQAEQAEQYVKWSAITQRWADDEGERRTQWQRRLGLAIGLLFLILIVVLCTR